MIHTVILILASTSSFAADSAVEREAALKTLRENDPCSLAIGRETGGKIANPVFCFTDIVKNRNTIDEKLGCAAIRYDLARHRVVGESDHFMSKKRCAEGGLGDALERGYRRMDDHRLLHSRKDGFKSRWEALDAAPRARAAGTSVATPEPALRKRCLRRKSGKWRYTGNMQIEQKKELRKNVEFDDQSAECRRYRKQAGISR